MAQHTIFHTRILLFFFALLLTAMLIATLRPFNFFPENGVHWLSDEPGIYFDGNGVAFSDKNVELGKTKEITIELLLKERPGSKNWGPKDIFSLYDGISSPSLHIGEWGSRIFLYSRFEKDTDEQWYKRFRINERFPRGKNHLITVTIGENLKAIYLDGKLKTKKKIELKNRVSLEFNGRIILGNSPSGANGWWGEIKGLAIYDRMLQADEVAEHYTTHVEKGFKKLRNKGSIVMYPFEEHTGNTVLSIVGNSNPILIPEKKSSFISALFHLPYKNMRKTYQISSFSDDFVKNIFFFIPYGFLLSLILKIKSNIGFVSILLIVSFSGGLLSLSIEMLQLYLPTRYAGIADVVSNSIGSFVGGITAIMIWSKVKFMDKANDNYH